MKMLVSIRQAICFQRQRGKAPFPIPITGCKNQD